MKKRWLAMAAVLILPACLANCGSSSPAPSGPAPLAIMIGDVPLCSVLSFRTQVNGLTLTPQGSSGVGVITADQTVPLDFATLRDNATVLDITSIQPGTYTGGTITLIAPAMSIFDPSQNPSVAQITPSFTTETVKFTISPPLVVPNCPLNSTTACSAAGLMLDLNLAQTIPVTAQGQITTSGSAGSLSISATPVLSGTALTASATEGFGELDDVAGYVLSVNNAATTSGNTNFIGSFTLQTLPGLETSAALTGAGPALSVNLTSASQLIGAGNLKQMTTGNFVEVNGHVDQFGTFVATRAVIEDQTDVANQFTTFVGYVLSVTRDASGNATQFQMTVTDEEPNTESSATSGNPVQLDVPPLIVTVPASTGWHFSDPTVNFASLTPAATDLQVGQRVIVAATYVPSPTVTAPATAPPPTATAANIYIPLQTISGNYVSLLASQSDNATGGFVFSPCSGFYQGQPIYVITNGQPGNNQFSVTQFVNLNGLAGLSPPPQLLVRGLLFFDAAGGVLNGAQVPPNSYVMFASKVHEL